MVSVGDIARTLSHGLMVPTETISAIADDLHKAGEIDKRNLDIDGLVGLLLCLGSGDPPKRAAMILSHLRDLSPTQVQIVRYDSAGTLVQKRELPVDQWRDDFLNMPLDRALTLAMHNREVAMLCFVNLGECRHVTISLGVNPTTFCAVLFQSKPVSVSPENAVSALVTRGTGIDGDFIERLCGLLEDRTVQTGSAAIH